MRADSCWLLIILQFSSNFVSSLAKEDDDEDGDDHEMGVDSNSPGCCNILFFVIYFSFSYNTSLGTTAGRPAPATPPPLPSFAQSPFPFSPHRVYRDPRGPLTAIKKPKQKNWDGCFLRILWPFVIGLLWPKAKLLSRFQLLRALLRCYLTRLLSAQKPS